MEITKATVLNAMKSMESITEFTGTNAHGGTATAISGIFGISGTSKAVGEILYALESEGKVKAMQTYTDRLYYIENDTSDTETVNEGNIMTSYNNHVQNMLDHGHTSYMTEKEYIEVAAYGFENDAFEIDSDLQNGWFDTVDDAIGFYVGLIED